MRASMQQSIGDRRAGLAIFALALLLRVAFVLWAPAEPTGDGLFYHQHARDLMSGNGYVNLDRSPANTWMPGWPAFLALLYTLFGFEPRVAMLANAVLSSATAVLVARLGRQLFSARIGAIAGLLYAVWPGVVYFSATLFNESLFSLLLVAALDLWVRAAAAERRRTALFAASGLLLGASAWVKAEPLLLCLPLALHLASLRRGRADFLRHAGLAFALATVVVLPWSIRNYVVFERVIPTAAGGGMVLYAANHAGARGGNDLASLLDYIERLGVADRSQAEQNMAIHDHAWRDVWDFVSHHPGEELRIMGNKLRLTYGGDSEGATLVRGHFGRDRWHLSEAVWRRLVWLADAFWFPVLALALVGASSARGWPVPTRVLIFGLLVTWLGLHLLFMGGMRFHHPEIPIFALLAAVGIDRLRERWRRSGLAAMALVLSVSGVACQPRGNELHDAIRAVVARGEGTRLDLRSATPFEWERLYVFAPYTKLEVVEAELGFHWPDVIISGIDEADHFTLLVFVRGGEVVGWLQHPRYDGDFAALARPGGYAPAESVFVVRRSAERGPWPVLEWAGEGGAGGSDSP